MNVVFDKNQIASNENLNVTVDLDLTQVRGGRIKRVDVVIT